MAIKTIGTLYTALNVPPAVGVLIAIFGLLFIHKVPKDTWRGLFQAANEPDIILLIAAALLYKLNLQAAMAVTDIVNFFESVNAPGYLLVFLIPFIVGFLTGVTMPTIAITFPFLMGYIGEGENVRIGLEVLGFSGVLCGLAVSPVHVCLPLSAGYFQTSLAKIITKLFLRACFIGLGGAIMAYFCG